jgi:hypothetical protein
MSSIRSLTSRKRVWLRARHSRDSDMAVSFLWQCEKNSSSLARAGLQRPFEGSLGRRALPIEVSDDATTDVLGENFTLILQAARGGAEWA